MKYDRILVVEDNPLDRELLVRVLKRLNCPIMEASSMMECQRAFSTHRFFRAVFVDVGLPDNSGSRVVTWIREHHPVTLIIVVTGDDRQATEMALYDAGAHAVFHKPYTSAQNSAVMNLLEVNSAAYKAGLAKRSWRTSACAGLALAATLASYLVEGEALRVNLRNAAIGAVCIGLAFGADAKAILGIVKKNGNGH